MFSRIPDFYEFYAQTDFFLTKNSNKATTVFAIDCGNSEFAFRENNKYDMSNSVGLYIFYPL